jgi:hypothetical protein
VIFAGFLCNTHFVNTLNIDGLFFLNIHIYRHFSKKFFSFFRKNFFSSSNFFLYHFSQTKHQKVQQNPLVALFTSYFKICAFLESSSGAVKDATITQAKTTRNFIFDK